MAEVLVNSIASFVISQISAATEKKLRQLIAESREKAIQEISRLIVKHTPVHQNHAKIIAQKVISIMT